jgi:thiol-disulfide isomerase/thioredoxin
MITLARVAASSPFVFAQFGCLCRCAPVFAAICAPAVSPEALFCVQNKLIVVDWSATWCGPCKQIAPLYEQLSEQHKANALRLLWPCRFLTSIALQNAIFLKVDVDELQNAAAEAGVQVWTHRLPF